MADDNNTYNKTFNDLNTNSSYNQQPDESYNDWKFRLLIDKANDDIDITWTKLALLLGGEFSETYYRRMGNSIAEYKAYLDEKQNNSNNPNVKSPKFLAIEQKEQEFQREKMKMQDQKRELNKKLREWARAEHIQSEIANAIKKVNNLKPFKLEKQEIIGGETEAALLLSDWHYGQFNSNFANTYNDIEFKNRINSILNKTIQYSKENKVKKLHVFALGDLINGLIHVTTRINNTENVIRQTMIVSEYLCDMLTILANNIDEIVIYFARGNHDRVTPNLSESVTAESFLDLIPWYLKARLTDVSNINIQDNQYDSEIIVTDILNSKIFAVHGHRDKITNVVQNLSLMLKVFPDYVFMGHFHHKEESEIQSAEVIVNGSLCGADEYAINIRKVSKPSQKLLIFDEDGKKCTYDLK